MLWLGVLLGLALPTQAQGPTIPELRKRTYGEGAFGWSGS
jgi:hypothetical protein